MYKFVQKNVKTGERKVAVKQISNEFNPAIVKNFRKI